MRRSDADRGAESSGLDPSAVVVNLRRSKPAAAAVSTIATDSRALFAIPTLHFLHAITEITVHVSMQTLESLLPSQDSVERTWPSDLQQECDSHML